MTSRSVSSFVSRDLDPRLSDAVITDSTTSLNTPSTASLKRRAPPYAVDSA
jgi:hypothetical protein